MKVLVIDVGGSNVKILATGQDTVRRVQSGLTMTAAKMAESVRQLADGWEYQAVAIGYPGVVVDDQPATEPRNLAPGWVEFDYRAAFGCPVKITNDAAMQALGSFERGKLLFLGLGTGLGATMVVDGIVLPMELAHLPYRKGSFEDYVGERGRKRYGARKWRANVNDVVARLVAALLPDDVVLGGGNARRLGTLAPGWRLGNNANAFVGGFRLWEPPARTPAPNEPGAGTPGPAALRPRRAAGPTPA